MRANRQRRLKTVAIAVSLVVFCMLLAPANAQGPSGRDQGLKKFLQNYERKLSSGGEKTTRYSAAFVDLRDDGKTEVIVYLMGPNWCGSGGCSALILTPEGSSYKVVTETSITQLPIRVLSTKTNGWHDLGVWVQGGGIQPGYEARLSFNGRKYPGNPSVPPAQKLHKKVEGKVAIAADPTGTPLW